MHHPSEFLRVQSQQRLKAYDVLSAQAAAEESLPLIDADVDEERMMQQQRAECRRTRTIAKV